MQHMIDMSIGHISAVPELCIVSRAKFWEDAPGHRLTGQATLQLSQAADADGRRKDARGAAARLQPARSASPACGERTPRCCPQADAGAGELARERGCGRAQACRPTPNKLCVSRGRQSNPIMVRYLAGWVLLHWPAGRGWQRATTSHSKVA